MIYGLTYDTDEGKLTSLGVLRKGDKKPNDRQPGPDLGERLRFAGVDPDVEKDWIDVFGTVLVDELDILLPYGDIDGNWQAWRECYVAGGLKYRCDGKNHVLWQDAEGNYHTDPQPCPGAPACEAKPVGRLELIVPRFGRLGTITLTTTSIHDIRNLDGALRATALRIGGLAMLPLRLTRVKRMISTPETSKQNGQEVRTGRRLRRAKWLLHLEPSPEWVRHMLASQSRTPGQLAGGTDVLALQPPADDLDGDDDATDVVAVEVPVAIDTSQAPALEQAPTNGIDAERWTPRIEGCTTVQALEALLGEIEAIDQPNHRDHVRKLAYRRIVAIVAAVLDKLDWRNPDAVEKKLAAAVTKLDPLPGDTPGLNLALDLVEVARQRLAELAPAPEESRAA